MKRGRGKGHPRLAMRLFISRVEADSDYHRVCAMLSVWKLMGFVVTLLIGFFLSNLDVTIVSSSLTSITDSLEGFEKRSWIITGYLATYTGKSHLMNL
ncbi:uncharacterized protein N7477_005011 [Penicillium maclennaniae]|uniref:uncharacterized protein n=1 Tax=Penicillium maclennaniae TaxID=1343394 RepID=UPI00253FF0AC|nr:uncharacterized protein N7477_005011 [Penicillium maclennaniae]KAJ5675077.1 hypothetical protein N7477_005011 [Penicillium maclennaniae]